MAQDIRFDNHIKAEKPEVFSNGEQIAEEACASVNANGQNAEEVCSDVNTEESSASVEPYLNCEECDFRTTSSVKMKIHSRCEHSNTRNLNSQHEKMVKEKYDNTKHYWK